MNIVGLDVGADHTGAEIAGLRGGDEVGVMSHIVEFLRRRWKRGLNLLAMGEVTVLMSKP